MPACINCGLCAQHCPSSLEPQELWRHSNQASIPPSELNLQACVLCGVCDYLCPSSLPLSSSFAEALHQLRLERKRKLRAQQAEQRYLARERRRQRERERLSGRRRQAWVEQEQQQPSPPPKKAAAEKARAIAREKCAQRLERLQPGSSAYLKLAAQLQALQD